jgi:chemotaxis response regulator CheB
MIRNGTCVIAGVLALLAGCGSGGKSGGGSEEVTVTLAEQNGSAESGTATLTKEGDRTKVVLDLQNPSATMASPPQPAHIHKGSCAKLDPTPAYALADVKDGASTSTVDAKLDDLRNGAFAINVHKSAADIKTYVACGDIGTGTSDSGSSPYRY